jgi:chemotaxis signal transduction protein
MHHHQVMQELKRIESGLDKHDNNQKLLEIQHKDSNRRIVTFNLGESCFAMPMDVLKEVSHVSPNLPVPNFPDWINCITAFRGKMVPVINLCKLFNYPMQEGKELRQQAIVDYQGATFAFLFDSIGEVLLVSQLVAGEGISKASNREAHMAQYVNGVYQKDQKLISLIDPAALVKICQQKGLITLREESAA